MSRASSHHNWGNVGYRIGRLGPVLQYDRVHRHPRQPGQLGRLALGRHPCLRFLLAAGQPRALRPARGRAPQHRAPHLLGQRPRHHTRHLRRHTSRPCGASGCGTRASRPIFLDPFRNYTAAHVGEKWIAYRARHHVGAGPGHRLRVAEEGTYNKEYVASRTFGFDEFKKLVLGESDGVPKTPAWAAEISGVEARTIRALAREWASHRTSLAGGTKGGEGGACRQAYATECGPASGLPAGHAGPGQTGRSASGERPMGRPTTTRSSSRAMRRAAFNLIAEKPAINPVQAAAVPADSPGRHPRPADRLDGQTASAATPSSSSSTSTTYPLPGPLRGQDVLPLRRLVPLHHGRHQQVGADVPEPQAGVRGQPGLLVVQRDQMADVILPACTNLERDDISEWASSGGYSLHASGSAEPPRHRLPAEMRGACGRVQGGLRYLRANWPTAWGTRRSTPRATPMEQWIEKMYDWSDLPKYMDFEDFKKKGYFVVPQLEDYKPTYALRWFAEGRPCDTPDTSNPKRGTDKAHELDDRHRQDRVRVAEPDAAHARRRRAGPACPSTSPAGKGTSPRASRNTRCSSSRRTRGSRSTPTTTRACPGSRRSPSTGCGSTATITQVCRIHPQDAEARGIKHGDVVKLYNDRAAVLLGAYVTERVRPGVVHSYEGASRYEPIERGNPDSPDRGGCVNLLSPGRMMSKNVPGHGAQLLSRRDDQVGGLRHD